MKSKFLVCKLFLFIIICSQHIMAQPLSGNYTIGSGGNYTSIDDAIMALQTEGISASVVFNLTDNLYEGYQTFPVISSTDATKTITFRGANNTKIKPAAGTTYGQSLWNVEGSNYKFINLEFDLSVHSYFYTIEITSAIGSNTLVDSCKFNGSFSTYGDYNAAVGTSNNHNAEIDKLIIKNSLFNNVGGPILIEEPAHAKIIKLQNNTLNDNYLPIMISNCDSSTVEGNRIFGSFELGIKITNSNLNANVNVENNVITDNFGYTGNRGIEIIGAGKTYCSQNYVYNTDNAVYIGNVNNLVMEGNTLESCRRCFYNNQINYAYIVNNQSIYISDGFQLSGNFKELTFSNNIIRIDTNNYYNGATALIIKDMEHLDGFYFPIQNNILEGTRACLGIENSRDLYFQLNTLILKPYYEYKTVMYANDLNNSRFEYNLLCVDSIGVYGEVADSTSMYSLLNTDIVMDENSYYLPTHSTNFFSIEDYAAATFSDFKNVSNYDSNSKFAKPDFYNENYLYEPTNPLLGNTITNTSGTQVDIYGRTRSYGYPGAVEGNYWNAGIEELNKNQVNIFPNPASNYINITDLAHVRTIISIVDITGRKVYESTSEINTDITELRLPQNIKNGYYTLILKGNHAIQTKVFCIFK